MSVRVEGFSGVFLNYYFLIGHFCKQCHASLFINKGETPIHQLFMIIKPSSMALHCMIMLGMR